MRTQRILLNGRKMTTRDELFIYLQEKFDLAPQRDGKPQQLAELLRERKRPAIILLLHADDLVEHLGAYGVRLIQFLRKLPKYTPGTRFYLINEDPEQLGKPRYWA